MYQGTFRHALPSGLVNAWFPLPHDLHAPSTARGLLADRCGSLGEVEQDELAVLASELVTNAVTHGRPDVTLHLVITSLLVRVDVFDHGLPIAPCVPVAATTTQSTGRGLAIVDRLATRWGANPPAGPRGKSVWFELDLARVS